MRLLLIFVSPPGIQGLQTAVNLAEAALSRGNDAIIFGTGDGVENLKKSAATPLAPHLTRLMEVGLRLMVCRESARSRGLSAEGDFIGGVEISSLAEMVELMDSCDRTLVFS